MHDISIIYNYLILFSYFQVWFSFPSNILLFSCTILIALCPNWPELTLDQWGRVNMGTAPTAHSDLCMYLLLFKWRIKKSEKFSWNTDNGILRWSGMSVILKKILMMTISFELGPLNRLRRGKKICRGHLTIYTQINWPRQTQILINDCSSTCFLDMIVCPSRAFLNIDWSLVVTSEVFL